MPNKNKTQKVDAPENASRYCRVVGASIVDQQGRGDGAYDLHDVKGTPEEVGAKIAASLKESSLSSAAEGDAIENGETLTLTLTIDISADRAKGALAWAVQQVRDSYVGQHPVKEMFFIETFDEGRWVILEEGGWDDIVQAHDFYKAEVGVTGRIVRIKQGDNYAVPYSSTLSPVPAREMSDLEKLTRDFVSRAMVQITEERNQKGQG